MRTRIIRIGNSQGVRIPKPLLEQSGLPEEVELEVRSDHIVIRAAVRRRASWSQAFAAMAQAGDDTLLDTDVPPAEWDDAEWSW